MICVHGYAKVNLTLEVLGRRPDGYHEIRSVVQTLRLHDTLWLERADAWQVDMPGAEIPDGDNLILRAGRALERDVARALPSHVRVEKLIPVSAGLGGGSSDAAAALVGLTRVWGLALGGERLLELAAELGSDVPVLLKGGTALIGGRGEEVAALPPLPRHWVVLAVPSLPASAALRPGLGKTAAMYAQLRTQHYTRGERTAELVQALRESVGDYAALRWNVFEAVAEQVFPGLGALREELSRRTGVAFRLSGAGPALYALLSDGAAARGCAERLAEQPVSTLVTTTESMRPKAYAVEERAALQA